MSNNKKQDEKNLKILRQLLSEAENRKCMECPSKQLTYVNLFNNSFVCTRCSGLLREFNHRVKSISASSFSPEEIKSLQEGGNEICRLMWMAKWKPSEFALPTDEEDTHRIREFIRTKYQNKKWYDATGANGRARTGSTAGAVSTSAAGTPGFDFMSNMPAPSMSPVTANAPFSLVAPSPSSAATLNRAASKKQDMDLLGFDFDVSSTTTTQPTTSIQRRLTVEYGRQPSFSNAGSFASAPSAPAAMPPLQQQSSFGSFTQAPVAASAPPAMAMQPLFSASQSSFSSAATSAAAAAVLHQPSNFGFQAPLAAAPAQATGLKPASSSLSQVSQASAGGDRYDVFRDLNAEQQPSLFASPAPSIFSAPQQQQQQQQGNIFSQAGPAQQSIFGPTISQQPQQQQQQQQQQQYPFVSQPQQQPPAYSTSNNPFAASATSFYEQPQQTSNPFGAPASNPFASSANYAAAPTNNPFAASYASAPSNNPFAVQNGPRATPGQQPQANPFLPHSPYQGMQQHQQQQQSDMSNPFAQRYY